MNYVAPLLLTIVALLGITDEVKVPAVAIEAISAPVVVVELFTSQGCSSCPAADKLLNDVIRDSEKSRTPVVGLSFHVTYWNYLGWKDPYSREEYTGRQKKYADVMKLSSIYTPQIIVNGEVEFVGSDAGKLASAIGAALRQTPRYQMQASASIRDREVMIQYSVDHEPVNELLNIAVVESYVQNEVSSGENKGRTLAHYNVVRKFETYELRKNENLKITIPSGESFSKGTSFVLFVQDPISLSVMAAVQIAPGTNQ